METKIWDCSFSQEDLEVTIGRALTEGEWNIVVDELYNNDELYNTIQEAVITIVKEALARVVQPNAKVARQNEMLLLG